MKMNYVMIWIVCNVKKLFKAAQYVKMMSHKGAPHWLRDKAAYFDLHKVKGSSPFDPSFMLFKKNVIHNIWSCHIIPLLTVNLCLWIYLILKMISFLWGVTEGKKHTCSTRNSKKLLSSSSHGDINRWHHRVVRSALSRAEPRWVGLRWSAKQMAVAT